MGGAYASGAVGSGGTTGVGTGGVCHATEARVDEIQEDIPWAREAVRLLRT
jgi:hypothetical protein